MTTSITDHDPWTDLETVLQAGIDRVLLYGPPGLGKTYAALTAGAPRTAYRLVCTEDLTSADIVGMWVTGENGGLVYQPGPAIRAWIGPDGRGGRLVVDEVDRASGDALSQLLAMTDSIESARWENPWTHEVVTPGPDFSVVMTTNVEHPDEIPAALRDRFPVAIAIDRPAAAALERLSEDLREPARHALGRNGLSLRGFYAYDALRRTCDAATAARLAFGSAAEAVHDALCVARVGQ